MREGRAEEPAPNRFFHAAAIAVSLTSAGLLIWSYTLPTVTFQRLAAERETYSIYGGIESLWEDGNWVLASIVFFFSMIWPIAKLATQFWLQLGGVPPQRRKRAVEWLRLLGRWSMLDVFVVGIFVGAIRFGFLAEGSSRPGIHVFALAILLSMVSTILVGRVDGGPEPVRRDGPPAWYARLVALVTAAGVAYAIAYPMLEIKKALIFRNEVVLPRNAERLAEEGELLVALPLFVFVIALPALRAILSLALRLSPRRPWWLARAALLAEEWAMQDVFALAMVIVFFKLDELATTTTLPAFWILLATGLVTNLDAWLLRRSARAG